LSITLEAQNYRALRQVSWKPSGVCALVGPNGSGKTTVLSLFQFLQDAFRKDLPSAIEKQGGPWRIRNMQADADDPVKLAISVGDLRWELQLGIRGSSIDPRPGERVTQESELLIDRALYSGRMKSQVGPLLLADNDPHLALSAVSAFDRPAKLDPLVAAIDSFRVFLGYDLPRLRRQGSPVSGEVELLAKGENAFTVLRNWQTNRELRDRFEFVKDGLRVAFPELSEDIDFEPTSTNVWVRMHLPGANPSDGVPAYFTPNGWLTGLLHLCAVAGAEPGSLVAIDEVENSLHPFAIRKLMEAFRDWAEDHDLTICLATHSPVVLDEFKEEPENVFVMEHGQEKQPVPLNELYDPDWLSRFSLGQLYAHGEFAGQRKSPPATPVGQGS